MIFAVLDVLVIAVHYPFYSTCHSQPMSKRRMAIANGTCVSFCNQPKAKFGYLACMSLSSPVLRVDAFGYVKRVY